MKRVSDLVSVTLSLTEAHSKLSSTLAQVTTSKPYFDVLRWWINATPGEGFAHHAAYMESMRQASEFFEQPVSHELFVVSLPTGRRS